MKSGIKNDTEITLKLPSNVVNDSDDDTYFPHKLILSNTQVSNLLEALANILSTNIEL